MRIRWRLAAYGAGVAAVAMVSFGILLTLLVRAAAPEEQDKTLAELVATTGASLVGISADELIAAAPIVPIDLASSTETFVAVYTADGTPVYTSGTVDGVPPRLPAAVIVEAGDRGNSKATVLAGTTELRIHAAPFRLDDAEAIVVSGQSTVFVEEQLNGLLAVVWIAAFLTLIAAGVVSWLVSGRALRPLRRLAETTDEIGTTGDLSRRLPPVASRDEVGALTSSFNGMLDRVQMAQQNLSESLDRQRRFVADASHELRGPLTTIRSNAGFLLDRADAAPNDRDDAIADIGAEADRMAALVDDLLILASVDAGRPLDRYPVDLAGVVGELERRAGHLDRNIRFHLGSPAVVAGDRAALARLTWILIDNAVRHGGGAVDVSVTADAAEVDLRVTDEGDGFPPDELGRIFDRFYRADAARSPAGAGLGLAIAREIAEAHGGSLTAANGSDGGAVLTATFPAA